MPLLRTLTSEAGVVWAIAAEPSRRSSRWKSDVKKYVLTAAVYEKPGNRGIWCVEAVDMMGSVEVFVTVFAGPNAQLRAMEYARAKYERVETDFESYPRTPALARPPRHAGGAGPWQSGGLGIIIDAERL
jgi:hypothetical protein